MFLIVPPKDGLALVVKLGPTFFECPPPMGFTYHKAQNKIYHESNLCNKTEQKV
jgi:hypothetical protein